MIKKNISLIFLVIIICASFTACNDTLPMEHITEQLYIVNKTDLEIYIRFDFLKQDFWFIDSAQMDNSLITYYDKFYKHNGIYNTVRLDTSQLEYTNSFTFYFDKSFIKDLWMSESEFNRYVSQIQIFKIHNNDTVFMNPELYNNKSKWKYCFCHMVDGSMLFIDSKKFATVINTLEINKNDFY